MSIASQPRAWRARFGSWPGNLRGALWLLLSSVLFSVMALATKLAGNPLQLDGFAPASALPSIEITFFRSLAVLLATAPFLLRHGGRAVRSGRPVLAVLRGCAGASGMLCNFYALIHLPLATAIAIQFARPLFLLLLAAVLLGELVTRQRGWVTAVGFVGVLIIVRPGPSMDPAAAVALLGGALIAISIILLRVLSRTDDTVALLFYSGIAGTTFTLLPTLAAWQWPSPGQWLLLAVIMVFGVAGQSCFMKGYAAGEASAMAPFDYSRLIFATLWGVLFFGQWPDLWTWLGTLLLLGATWYALSLQAGGGAPGEPRGLDHRPPPSNS